MMRRTGHVSLLAGCVALLATTAPAIAEEIQWAESFEKAQELAKTSGKLLMVDFWKDH